jgi:AraC-like DNA-binding protein
MPYGENMNSISLLTESTHDRDCNEGCPGVQASSLLIRSELEWFKRPTDEVVAAPPTSQAILARWVIPEALCPIELSSNCRDASHTLTLFLRSTRGKWFFGDKPFHEGEVALSSLWIKEPYHGARAVYDEGSTSFRVYLPQSLITESYESVYGRPPSSELNLSKTRRTGDRVLRNLVRLLVDADESFGASGPSFLDGVSLAIASRLIALDSKQTHLRSFDKVPTALPKWRLKRSIDYIEANLTTPIYLIELSNAVGLSRMHFAAQFRAATGYTPNRYILRRKISRAQSLLRDHSMSVVDIALILGFRTQAHFTVVFKSIVGYPPAQWRKLPVDLG